MNSRRRIAVLLGAALAALVSLPGIAQAAPVAAEPPRVVATAVASYDAFDANQGVAVDAEHFYAVNNSTITQHDRESGAPLRQFVGAEDGPFLHLDSGAVVDGLLYSAHSNYPDRPILSSVEVFDTATMQHVETHSFGIDRGSLTWLDRHDGSWWAGFANYDVIQDGDTEPYGGTINTQVVQLDDDFRVVQSFAIPAPILARIAPMSNSGGSWGPDGRLYLTGHDLPEAYVMTLPSAGSELRWIGTVDLPGIEGQGIAWDDASLWGISRDNRKVISFSVPVEAITDPDVADSAVVGPGEFVE